MTRRLIIASLSALLFQQCLAAPESTTAIQLYQASPPVPLEASIVDVQNDRTTLKLFCPPDSTLAACGPLPQNTYTFGPGTYLVQGGLEGQYTFTSDCSTASNTAVCQCYESADTAVLTSNSMTVTDFTTSYSTTFAGDDIMVTSVPIVGGLEKLPTSTTSATAVSSTSSPVSQGTSSSPSPAQGVSSTSTALGPTDTASGGTTRNVAPFVNWVFAFCVAISISV